VTRNHDKHNSRTATRADAVAQGTTSTSTGRRPLLWATAYDKAQPVLMLPPWWPQVHVRVVVMAYRPSPPVATTSTSLRLPALSGSLISGAFTLMVTTRDWD